MMECLLEGWDGLFSRCSPTEDGVVIGINPEMENGCTHLVGIHEGHSEWFKPEELKMDLSDQTGRAHAAFWLSKQLHTTSVSFGLLSGHFPGDLWVPAFDFLDRYDPRSLADGFLWVRAEALRLACLHFRAKGHT